MIFFVILTEGLPRFASKSDALFFILTEGLPRFASKNDDFFQTLQWKIIDLPSQLAELPESPESPESPEWCHFSRF